MAKILTNKNVIASKFIAADFTGEWLASFGRPELAGSWLVYGPSGSGKTSFMLQLAKYLSNFRRVAYDSLEQGLSLSFKKGWERVRMEEAGNNIVLLDKVTLSELYKILDRRRSPDVIIVDSIHYWLGLKQADYMNLLSRYPHKLFIFVAHEKNGEPKGQLGILVKYNSDVKIHVQGYKAMITTRYQDAEKGEGGQDFTIWEEGANNYWLDKL